MKMFLIRHHWLLLLFYLIGLGLFLNIVYLGFTDSPDFHKWLTATVLYFYGIVMRLP